MASSPRATAPRDDSSLGTRARAILDWLRRRTDTAVGRLALEWWRSYFAASRNSACAATIYSALSVLPTALVLVAVIHPSESDANAFAERIVTHMRLTGTTASLVLDTFGSTSANALAATVVAVVSFLIWGIGIGQLYQEVYARAWGVEVHALADQGLFAGFFFLISGAVALFVATTAWLDQSGWLVLVPVWLLASTGYWLLVPSLLLHRRIGLRALLPGALVSSIVVGGTIATSPLFFAPTLEANAKAFGSFGVVLTLVAYVFILITMSLACAVFSPVWRRWRESERRRRET